ncbi:MAG TPA: tyrosine--tRNA ligase [Candidatus Paceibacterota bacterium]|nr:tyrosine--tRNA ligase [Candidatus Paceibacterota bacterium]
MKTAVITDPAKIKDLLERDTEDIVVRESLEKKLMSGKQLRVKLGIDPTSENIHIGRAVPLRKLRAFQDLGHIAVFIVGDFTAQIGDASDKLSKRPMLLKEDVEKNMKTYKEQVGKIIDLDKAEFHHNSTWLSKLTFVEAVLLAESFSVQQMLARRNFSDRYEKGEEISLREFMYPLMQGYDSVAIDADIEIGGFDQLFNVKAGRTIQKFYGKPEQDIITLQMLEGTDGRKMSSSWGNVITINAEPEDMYGKVMSVSDELIEKYFRLCTAVPLDEIAGYVEKIKSGVNPKEVKMILAKEIVTIYHGASAAEKAESYFTNVFTNKQAPEEAQVIEVPKGQAVALALRYAKIIPSASEWSRLVEGGGVTYAETGEKITNTKLAVENDMYLKVGKRKFVKIKVV